MVAAWHDCHPCPFTPTGGEDSMWRYSFIHFTKLRHMLTCRISGYMRGQAQWSLNTVCVVSTGMPLVSGNSRYVVSPATTRQPAPHEATSLGHADSQGKTVHERPEVPAGLETGRQWSARSSPGSLSPMEPHVIPLIAMAGYVCLRGAQVASALL